MHLDSNYELKQTVKIIEWRRRCNLKVLVFSYTLKSIEYVEFVNRKKSILEMWFVSRQNDIYVIDLQNGS